MSTQDELNNFKNMMRLAEYGAMRHTERRQILFRIFIAYMTLLVVILSLILKYVEVVKSDGFAGFTLFAIIFLLGMLITYWKWLITFYHASDYDVRRRDFYLSKAQVINYHKSKGLGQCYSSCKKVYINLGNNGSYKLNERCLFEKRMPDIIPENCVEKVSPPTVKGNWHFRFHLCGPLGLTLLIVIALLLIF